jgi:metal-sulfur cluster biosynthetic enzyme
MDSTRRMAVEALQRVVDPEIGLDIVTLGFIYGLEVTPSDISLTMTLTSLGCPLGDILVRMAREALLGVAGTRRVDVKLSFDPPWDSAMITEEGRRSLQLY